MARTASAALAALGLSAILACATSAPAPDARACAGFVPPVLVSAGSVPLPSSYTAARVGAPVTSEAVVARDGSVANARFVHANYPMLGPFAEESLKRSRFTPAQIEGNRVAARVEITAPIGILRKTKRDPPYDSLRAFVPGGESREARWQLAGSVVRLTLVAHIGSAVEGSAAVVAVAPSQAEKTLLTLPAAASPREIRETVKTGGFLGRPGDYRLEIRAGGKALARTTVTIAADSSQAIVNACEPLAPPEKN